MCLVYVQVRQGKLEPRALKGIFIGYPKGIKGYKVWCTDFTSLKCIRHVTITFHKVVMVNYIFG